MHYGKGKPGRKPSGFKKTSTSMDKKKKKKKPAKKATKKMKSSMGRRGAGIPRSTKDKDFDHMLIISEEKMKALHEKGQADVIAVSGKQRMTIRIIIALERGKKRWRRTPSKP